MATIVSYFASNWSRILIYSGAVLIIIGGLYFFYGHAEDAGQQIQENADLKQGLKDVKAADKIEQKVNALPSGAATNELLKSYSRD